MYRIYADNWLLHDDILDEYKVSMPKLALEINKTGAFQFSIYPDHIYYNKITKVKTIITVWQDDTLLFRGRVLNDELGFYNEKQVTCEGELAFLLDSIQRPYDFTGSVLEYFTLLVSNHNAQVEEPKRFTVGSVTVTDSNDYIVRSNIDHVNTWEEINKKLLDVLGGYLWVRHEEGINYIDYLDDLNRLSTQSVEFGENLIDLKRIIKGEDITTALIPLGAKLKNEDGQDTDERLTVASVNFGLDYIFDADAVAAYGWIFQTATWDDITEAQNLLTKGQAHLAGLVNPVQSVELSAIDLAKVNKNVGSFNLGSKVLVKSKPHGIEQLFMVSKLDISLLEPTSNKLTLGGTFRGFSDAIHGLLDNQGQIVRDIEKNAKNANEAVYNVERNFQSEIAQTAQNITATVAERYYLKDETDSLISEVSSTLEQTASGFEMRFNRFSTDLESVIAGTDAEFELYRRYIRFVNGSILLGEAGNELELKISNDRISFLQDGLEVAYFSNNKLNVTDGHFINSLQIGNFAYIPRANGNLSFKKLEAQTGGSIVGLAQVNASVTG